jgi:membrane protease YdiL (CAAX protease family)
MQRDPAALDFVERSELSRPARTDHVFTWKARDFEVPDATYRFEVTVLGSEVGGYREYLKVPEKWKRAYEGLRSRNLTAQTIDTGLMMLLAVGLLVTIALRLRRRDVQWRPAAVVGGIGALLYFLANWNAQPLAEFNYPTTDSYASFLAQEFLRNLTGALGAGGLLFVLAVGAEPMYRESYSPRLWLSQVLRPRGWRTRQFFIGTVLGLTLAGVFVAYQTGFYMVAERFGAWSPVDVPYDDLLNTRLPWLFVLLGGFLPAVSEEFLFRMFAIPFFSQLLRSVPVAVVAAAFIWGFGHAGYPQQPYWIRGMEVGIGGVVLGLVMLRWGILPTLVWHYSVDAMYTALLLLRSHNLYFILSGAASAGIMVLPVVIAWLAYWRRGGFEPEVLEAATTTEPLAAPRTQVAQADGAVVTYSAWSMRRRVVALSVAAAGAVAIAVVHVDEFGNKPRFALGPAQARAIAEQFAQTHRFNPQPYRVVTYPATAWDEGLAGKYFVERRSIAFLGEAFRQQVPLYGWMVRFFRPLEREELRVSVDPESGRVFEYDHILPEDQPGADLPATQAAALVTGLPEVRGMDLKESRSEKKKARRDYTLVFEAKPEDGRNLDEARFRVRAGVAGDQLVSLSSFWKLPEAFERARSRRNALSNVLLVLRIAVIAGLLVWGVWVLIDYTRRGGLRWRPVLWVALPVGGVSASAMVMSFPLLFSQYPTSFPLESYEAVTTVGLIIGALALLIGLACAAGVILALRPEVPAAMQATGRRRMAPDALVATAVAAVAALAMGRWRWMLIDRFHAQALLSADMQTMFGAVSPAVSAIASACRSTVFGLAVLALVAHAVRALSRWRGAVVAAGVLVAAALAPSDVHTVAEFLLYYGICVTWLVVAWLFVRYVARENYLAYALSIWTLLLAARAADLLAQPAATLRVQGGVVMAVLVATAIWGVAPWAGRAAAVQSAAAPGRQALTTSPGGSRSQD